MQIDKNYSQQWFPYGSLGPFVMDGGIPEDVVNVVRCHMTAEEIGMNLKASDMIRFEPPEIRYVSHNATIESSIQVLLHASFPNELIPKLPDTQCDVYDYSLKSSSEQHVTDKSQDDKDEEEDDNNGDDKDWLLISHYVPPLPPSTTAPTMEDMIYVWKCQPALEGTRVVPDVIVLDKNNYTNPSYLMAMHVHKSFPDDQPIPQPVCHLTKTTSPVANTVFVDSEPSSFGDDHVGYPRDWHHSSSSSWWMVIMNCWESRMDPKQKNVTATNKQVRKPKGKKKQGKKKYRLLSGTNSNNNSSSSSSSSSNDDHHQQQQQKKAGNDLTTRDDIAVVSRINTTRRTATTANNEDHDEATNEDSTTTTVVVGEEEGGEGKDQEDEKSNDKEGQEQKQQKPNNTRKHSQQDKVVSTSSCEINVVSETATSKDVSAQAEKDVVTADGVGGLGWTIVRVGEQSLKKEDEKPAGTKEITASHESSTTRRQLQSQSPQQLTDGTDNNIEIDLPATISTDKEESTPAQTTASAAALDERLDDSDKSGQRPGTKNMRDDNEITVRESPSADSSVIMQHSSSDTTCHHDEETSNTNDNDENQLEEVDQPVLLSSECAQRPLPVLTTTREQETRYYEFVLYVHGMTCQGCEGVVHNTLANLEDVASVVVSWKDASATIQSSVPRLNLLTVAQAINDVGFDMFMGPTPRQTESNTSETPPTSAATTGLVTTCSSATQDNDPTVLLRPPPGFQSSLSLMDELRIGSTPTIRRYRCRCGEAECICSAYPIHNNDPGREVSLSDLCKRIENNLRGGGGGGGSLFGAISRPEPGKLEDWIQSSNGGSGEFRQQLAKMPIPCGCGKSSHDHSHSKDH